MEIKQSFTRKIKEEICDLDFDEQTSKSILSSFIRINGTISFSSNGEKLILKTENSKVAKFIYSNIKKNYIDADASFSFRKIMKFNKNIQYLVNITSFVDEILKDLHIDFLEDKIPFDMTNKDEKVKGYLTGAFLATGSCNDPHSSNYHLELATRDEGFSYALIKLIHKIKDIDFNFKVIQRRNNFVVYLKKSDQIADFLSYIDANNSCLDFESIRVNRDFANVSNRLINMDTYNMKKTIEKGIEQCKQIEEIDRWLGINNITNQKLRELCYLRLENKEANYNDLAEMLSEKIGSKVSKSNINHLFIKIREMAEEHKHEY